MTMASKKLPGRVVIFINSGRVEAARAPIGTKSSSTTKAGSKIGSLIIIERLSSPSKKTIVKSFELSIVSRKCLKKCPPLQHKNKH